MSDVWAFEHDCSIEPVEAVAGDWFSDTSVPGPPAPIEDCAFVDLPQVPDPPVCPTLPGVVSATTRAVKQGYEGLTMTVTEGAGCAFDFALDAKFPVGCPTLPLDPVPARTTVVPPRKSYARFRFEEVTTHPVHDPLLPGSLSSQEPAPCAFDFDAEIGFACVQLSGPGRAAAVHRVGPKEGAAALRVVDRGSCSYELDLSIDFPDTSFSPSCVSFNPEPRLDVSYVPPGRESFTLKFGRAYNDCSYSLEGTLKVPRPGGVVGKVLSGGGGAWSVRLYPDGPGAETTAFNAAVDVRNAALHEYPPVGAYVAPVLPLGPWGTGLNGPGSRFEYMLPSFLELEIGRTATGGIPARSGATPGHADNVTIMQFGGGDVSMDPAKTGRVYNVFGSVVGATAGTYILIGKVAGFRFVVAEDCTGG